MPLARSGERDPLVPSPSGHVFTGTQKQWASDPLSPRSVTSSRHRANLSINAQRQLRHRREPRSKTRSDTLSEYSTPSGTVKTTVKGVLTGGPREESDEYAVNCIFFRRIIQLVWMGWDKWCTLIVIVLMFFGAFQAKAGNDFISPLGNEITVGTINYLGTKKLLEEVGCCNGTGSAARCTVTLEKLFQRHVYVVPGIDLCNELKQTTRKNLWHGGGRASPFCSSCIRELGNASSAFTCYGPMDKLVPTHAAACTATTTNRNLIKGQATGSLSVVGWYLFWELFCPIVIGLASQWCTILNQIVRRNLTKKLHHLLLRRRHLYRLVSVQKEVDFDNYDQRISQDIDSFLSGSFGPWFGFWCTGCSCYFGMKAALNGLLSYSHDLTYKFLGIAAAMLVITSFTYLYTMNIISRVMFNLFAYEGSFRWSHSRTVEQAEAICVYGGEEDQKKQTDERFGDVVRQFIRWSLFQSALSAGIVFFSCFNGPIAITFVYFAKIGGADILSMQMYVSNGIGSFCSLSKTFASISIGSGCCHRVGVLLETLRAIEVEVKLLEWQQEDAADAAGMRAAAKEDADRIECVGLTLCPPGVEGDLFQNLSLRVEHGERVCIVGPTGSGKTALLRAVEGMWAPEAGAVVRPRRVGRGGILFVPQRPYVPHGTLRQLVAYPDMGDGDDRLITLALAQVQLAHLVDKFTLDMEMPWPDLLSGGETQRAGIARLLYHRPRFAILDEATSACNAELERRLLGVLSDTGMGLVQALGREPWPGQCDRVLRLGTKGADRWRVDSPDGGPAAAAEVAKEPEKDEEVDEPPPPFAGLPEPDKPSGPQVFFRAMRGLRVFWRLTFTSWTCQASLIFYLLVVLQFVGSLNTIISSEVGGKVNTALLDWNGGKQQDNGKPSKSLDHAFWERVTYQYCNGIILFLLIGAQIFYGMRLSMCMREAVTLELHRRYFRKGVPYAANVADRRVDTIDQRMVQDQMIIVSSLQPILFGGLTGMDFKLGAMIGFMQVVTLLVYGAYKYSWFATAANFAYIFFWIPIALAVAMPLGRASFLLARAEGYFRFAHARLREFAESVRFLNSEERELARVNKLIDAVFYRQIISAVAGIGATVTGWLQGYLNGAWGCGMCLSLTALYLGWGVPAAEEYMTAISFFATFSSTLGQYNGGFNYIGFFSGVVHRANQLLIALDDGHEYALRCADAATHDPDCVQATGLSLATPAGTQLFTGVDFCVRRGEHLLIRGPSGAGKSSLLRVVAGLWAPQAGKLRRPEKGGPRALFFMPQKAYLPEGTLREQVLFPVAADMDWTDDELRGVLAKAGLSAATECFGLDEEMDWSKQLSGGEMQRLGFARLLCHRPDFAVLDEATSLLDRDGEAEMMELCKEVGVTLVSVAHRESMRRWHRQQLTLDGAGGHSLAPIGAADSDPPTPPPRPPPRASPRRRVAGGGSGAAGVTVN